MTTYKNFPVHLYTTWIEVHWSIAGTREQVEFVLNKNGYKWIELYKVDFGWWAVIKEQK